MGNRNRGSSASISLSSSDPVDQMKTPMPSLNPVSDFNNRDASVSREL